MGVRRFWFRYGGAATMAETQQLSTLGNTGPTSQYIRKSDPGGRLRRLDHG